MAVRRNHMISVTATNENFYSAGLDDSSSLEEARVFPTSGVTTRIARGRQDELEMDQAFNAELNGASPTAMGNCPSVNSQDLMFLSHTPPVGTPSSYGVRAYKQGRRNPMDWGGRSVQGEELSSSFSDMRLSSECNTGGHQRRKYKETEERDNQFIEKRITAFAQLERSGVVHPKQTSIIKDRVVLGDYEELNVALDEYMLTSDSSLFRALLASGVFREVDDDDLTEGDGHRRMASVGHEFDSLMDLESFKAASLDEDLQDVAAVLAASSYSSSTAGIIVGLPLSSQVTDDRTNTTSSHFGDFEMEIDGVLAGEDDDEDDDDQSVAVGVNRRRSTIITIGYETVRAHNFSDYNSEDDDDDRVSSSKSAPPSKRRTNKSTSSSSSSQQQQKKSPGGRRKSASATTPGSTTKKSARTPGGSGTRRKKKDDDEAATHRRKSKGTPNATSKGGAAAGDIAATPLNLSTHSATADHEGGNDNATATKEEKKSAVSTDKTAKVLPATVEGAVSSTVTDLPPLNQLPEGEAPTYDVLINYPRAKARGTRHCVMCGRPSPPDRPTPQQTPQPTQTPAQQQQQQPLSPTTDDVSNPPALSTPTTATETANAATPATAVASTPVGKGGDVTPHPLIPATPATPEVHSATNDYAVIPRQNKDVCRECDKATWRHTCTGCFFKWCKGCKRFRNLIAFKGKLQASKCDYCRARGRLGYMRRKCDGNDDEAARQHPETPLETGGPSEENRPPEQQLTTATESGAAAATVAVAVALTAAAAPAVPVPSASLAAAPVPTPTDVNMASTE